MSFDRHAILKRHYAQQIAQWDWPAIVAAAERNKEPDTDNGDGYIGRDFLGTCFAVMPSGKYYMPWTTNQTRADETRDSAFMEALEEAAEQHGGCIESGEGDPCDMFFCKYYPATPEGATELWLCQDCMFAEVNGDTSGIENKARETLVRQSLAELTAAGHLAPNFEEGFGERIFSRLPCDCCGETLAGARFRFAQFPKERMTKKESK